MIDGLLGTQTDLAFTLTLLDGRSYSRILRPLRPGFLVPENPSAVALAGEAAISGVQRTVRHLSLWLVLIVAAGGGYLYDCRWAVVARVQHLQHVHHRQQIYGGVLTLRAEDDGWKVAGVELHSEDRVVLPWEPT